MVSRVATTIRSGLIHAGGTRRTDSDAVIPRALRYRPQIETDGIFCSIGRRDARVVAHDRLSARRVAAQLPAVVVGERFFDCGYVFGGNAAQALLIAADGRNLRDDAAQPPVCRAKYDSVAASIAGTPQADAFGVDDIQCFEVADRASPVGYLAPRVDIDPWRQIADWRRAISYLETLDVVDAKRIGLWGTSYAGGHAIVLGATDRRLRCVVAQVPTISGYEQGLRRIPPESVAAIEEMFSDDDRAQLRGEPPRRQAVVSDDPSIPASYRARDAID